METSSMVEWYDPVTGSWFATMTDGVSYDECKKAVASYRSTDNEFPEYAETVRRYRIVTTTVEEV